jgi:polyhydroxybutyrate depolymerase
MMKKIGYVLLTVLLLFSCANEPQTEVDYQVGKNRFITVVNGDDREYFVHVPTGYDDSVPTPVVFMLHGTTGSGEVMYNISGWKELAETENILTIYPSSWRYCIIDQGEVKNTTKWNIYPGSFEYCAGEVPRDDIRFLKQVVTEMQGRFHVDEKRIYLAGFSNGGAMAFRAAVEMGDVFAAVVEASASVATALTMVPKRNLPLLFQIGNSDDQYLGSDTIPMSEFENWLNDDPWFKAIVFSHTTTFSFSSAYAISGDASKMLVATFAGIPDVGKRNFLFMLIKDLDHQYPNGSNHWMKGAESHWEWFSQFTLR